MTRVVVLPHLVASDSVRAGPWSVRVGGVAHDPSTRLVDWDHQVPLEVESELTIDPVAVRDECELDSRAPLALLATWHATATNERRVGFRADLDEACTRTVRFALDPALAGGSVRLVRTVVLARDHESPSPLSAWRAGSVLWRERSTAATTIELQSPADGLGLEAVDFADCGSIEPDAAWRFELDLTDPYRPAAGSLHVMVNTAHPAVGELLSAEPTENRRLLESVFRWEIASTLLDHALAQPSFVEGFGAFPPDTVGGLAQRVLELHVPDVGVEALAVMRRRSPHQLRALLQGRLRLLRSR